MGMNWREEKEIGQARTTEILASHSGDVQGKAIPCTSPEWDTLVLTSVSPPPASLLFGSLFCTISSSGSNPTGQWRVEVAMASASF